ncbi:M55 family metallopeptidase [Desulfurococcaceae archaeon MEX13E-LK6-19]|nr:M55 family metallopeptidase [Desulfurococcaceae archaeon MEX13E-LK6-19]
MRAYVSVDFEGLPGIPVGGLVPRSPQYSRSEWIVTRISKAVVEKLLASGFDKVTLADSHGYMTNIDYREIPRGVTLVQGFPRPLSMITGIEEGYDAAYFIGYHAAAGTMKGYLDHTYSGMTFHRVYINGHQTSEFLLNALVAGEYGVPVVLVAGDKALETDVEKHTPWAVFVPLKQGLGRYAASFESLPEVIESLEKGVEESVKVLKEGKAKPLVFEKPMELVVELRETVFADAASLIPGVMREGAYKLVYKAESAKELMEVIEAITLVCFGIASLREKLR